MSDYRYLRQQGECGPVLTYLAQDPERWMSAYPLSKALDIRSYPVYQALDILFRAGLIRDKWEGKLNHERRFYAVTKEGLRAAEQLNT